MAKFKINFKDIGQDLTHVVIDTGEDPSGLGRMENIGEIVAVSAACFGIVADMYIGKVVDLGGNQPGANFEHVDPSKGFAVQVTRWVVESVEEVQP